jgi:hypothetical protein
MPPTAARISPPPSGHRELHIGFRQFGVFGALAVHGFSIERARHRLPAWVSRCVMANAGAGKLPQRGPRLILMHARRLL